MARLSRRLSSEQRLRARLARLIKTEPLAHGTLAQRSRVCGKPRCSCARGELHASLYLVQRKSGRLHQLYVPKARERWVRNAVSNYRKAIALMDQLSARAWRSAKTGRSQAPAGHGRRLRLQSLSARGAAAP